jgi:uncharacterized protein YndB with AHSA1/START domain
MEAHATDIISTRLIDASREQVFAAFADPGLLARWWGPQGFTNTFAEFDFQPGGMWRFTMHAPDGADYPNESEFVEITEPEKIVFIHHQPVHVFRMTMIFTEEEGKTRVVWQMRFETPADAEKFRKFIESANQQNFDRLESVLQSTTP